MKPSRALIVVYNAAPLKSGAAMQAITLQKELSKEYDTVVYSIDKVRVHNSSYEREYIGSGALFNFFCMLRVTYKILFGGYDLVHHTSLSKYTYLSVLLARLFKQKVIVKMTMFGIDEPSTIKRNPFLNLIYSRLDSWIAIAPGMLDDTRSNVRFIPNSVTTLDRHDFAVDASKRFVFLCSGVICERKNQLRVLEFWDSIRNRDDLKGLSKKLVFIGSYDNDYIEFDHHYVREFLSKASQYDDVEVVGHTNDVASYLSKASHYVSFSTQEGLSNSLLEALSYMLYPVVFDEGRVTLVQDLYQFGYYFDDFDSIDFDFFAELDKEALFLNLEKYYSLDSVVQSYKDVYNYCGVKSLIKVDK